VTDQTAQTSVESTVPRVQSTIHRENAGTLERLPLIINPIYTLYSGYLLGIPRAETARVPPKGTSILPLNNDRHALSIIWIVKSISDINMSTYMYYNKS